MSRSLSPSLREFRARILSSGRASFHVYRDSRRVATFSSWENANEAARFSAASHIGDEYRVEERRTLDGVSAVARVRYWLYYFPLEPLHV